MKSRELVRGRRARALSPSAIARTGEHCPASGWWSPSGWPSSARFIAEGSTMPTYDLRPVLWVPAGALAADAL